jgi:hypothetical protein
MATADTSVDAPENADAKEALTEVRRRSALEDDARNFDRASTVQPAKSSSALHRARRASGRGDQGPQRGQERPVQGDEVRRLRHEDGQADPQAAEDGAAQPPRGRGAAQSTYMDAHRDDADRRSHRARGCCVGGGQRNHFRRARGSRRPRVAHRRQGQRPAFRGKAADRVPARCEDPLPGGRDLRGPERRQALSMGGDEGQARGHEGRGARPGCERGTGALRSSSSRMARQCPTKTSASG